MIMRMNNKTILKKMRKQQKISQQELSIGLCSISTLSRIESGEREPDQMLFDSIISRLGKDSAKWELILKENDKKLLQKRNYIEYLIQVEEWEELKEELEKYKGFRGVTRHLQEQYVCLVKAILYKQERKYEFALQSCYEGLGKTKLQVDDKNFKLIRRVSRNELRLLYILGEILYEYPSKENNSIELYDYWRKIAKYVEDFCTDEQYRLPFYIKVKYYLASIAYKEKRYSKSVVHFQDGMRKIKEKKSICCLNLFLILSKKLKKIDDTFFSDSSEEEINLLLQILEYWKEKNKNLYQKEKYVRPGNSVYSISEVIKNTRTVLGKTQEELTEWEKELGISRQASISEIENGKRNPRKLTREYCLEKLGLEEKIDSFQLSIEGEDFEIQELRNEIDCCISTHNLLKAERLLDNLKEKIDCSEICNEQYIRKVELFIKNEKENISYEQWKKEILELLSLTIHDVSRINEMAFFSQEEASLIMNFGCMCQRNKKYEEAREYYESLERYFDMYYPTASSRIYKLLLHNLSQVYGMLGEYEKAIEKSNISVFLEMSNMNAFMWFRSVYNIAWCYGKKMLGEKESRKKEKYRDNCKEFFRQSYILAKFYQDKILIEAIEDKMRIWNI